MPLRMFRWKTVLVCDESIDAAWDTLVEWAKEWKESTMTEVLQESQHFEIDAQGRPQDTQYTGTDPREYLHAIDPEEFIEILWMDLPSDSGFWKAQVDSVAFESMITLQARHWATLLPQGAIFPPGGSVMTDEEAMKIRELFHDLWGKAAARDYDKQKWKEMQRLLFKIDRRLG